MLDILSYFLFVIMLIVIVGAVVYFFIRYFKDEGKVDRNGGDNNTIATVIDKREEALYGTSSSLFITFKFKNGNRKELAVNRNAYGLLVKGDKGRVTFNGRQLVSFTRVKKKDKQ